MGNFYINKKNNFQQAFTVVELIMVVLVIGILVSLSVVAYNGIRNKAAETALLSDLDNAISILEHDLSANGAYPDTVELADGGRGLPVDSGTTYQYSVNNSIDPPYFCLTGTNGSSSKYINSSLTTSTNGACPGHIGAGDTNLATNGLGELGNNTNFTSLTFDANDFPAGSQGSFISPNGNSPFIQAWSTYPWTIHTNTFYVAGQDSVRLGLQHLGGSLGLLPTTLIIKSFHPNIICTVRERQQHWLSHSILAIQ